MARLTWALFIYCEVTEFFLVIRAVLLNYRYFTRRTDFTSHAAQTEPLLGVQVGARPAR